MCRQCRELPVQLAMNAYKNRSWESEQNPNIQLPTNAYNNSSWETEQNRILSIVY